MDIADQGEGGPGQDVGQVAGVHSVVGGGIPRTLEALEDHVGQACLGAQDGARTEAVDAHARGALIE
jgi:hypothetical protein